jgi:hypothetical protein
LTAAQKVALEQETETSPLIAPVGAAADSDHEVLLYFQTRP